ncbi:bifunctional [glutamate--ammonia ligase]-adenylyl-L-tyrosine phosphorylase/[glutamate--ammonia-ligase] adenylyltransferase [Usitatibacter palustris]|uniref:Bifunctional glutamine synthetase adenylyltransferase/adenylyl-removing enzyme n=1 Tax=Usitatibacter palustris TaxID=2732487 RepID=A0A6M4H959_9PROT|nr:bifunctional [glutamate--ammonia ligase]-adenylyl-L-tyrosine phosphorylase/[glutamate--ammonia-ligase] adenylyltransferase [Usitatibacter palustris]QJR15735.1 Bifunctional glutamine synthetase adenylyltransferase/adenylyl-removing enzyme [Usitatibacter palustris]
MSDRPFSAALEKTLRLSPFCARLLAARPALRDELESTSGRPFGREEMRSRIQEGDSLADSLRDLRAAVLLRLAHRDLNGLAPLAEVVATMTDLAEVAIGAACAQAEREATAAHGAPQAGVAGPGLIVAGLGKLGGCELNVSSDIDLVFIYGEDGETSGPRPISHPEYYALVGKRLIALLAEITERGQVFRVDMRLRPYGDSGPLVCSLASLENYFIAQARPWERYAWLKARTVSGAAVPLQALIDPFVYRRYLDYGLLGALRELHARIFEAAVQRRKADDIKVGAGGIREIEFVAQLHQLVRGGHDAGLRLTSTREALAALAARGLIEPAHSSGLNEAYTFLRTLEHRLQYYDDQQTQSLPVAAEHRAAIAEAMGFTAWEPFLAVLDGHRAVVQESFAALFDRPPSSGTGNVVARLNDPQATPDVDALAEDLARIGLTDATPVAARLVALATSRRYRSLSSACRTKIDALLPLVVEAAAREGGKAETALRLFDMIEAIDRREAYLALLVEYPQVLQRAARLAARSAWAARLLARHPILLDELLRTAASFTATDWEAERRELLAECATVASDTERLLDTLRHYKQRHMLRFTIADLEGELPVMALSDELSALADLILEATMQEAAASLGRPRGPIPGFAVIGYGKLGGKELGYGSDLDIVFLYDEALAGEAEVFARISQRVNSWLTSHTSAGILYETDLRLRPDGAAGLLVSSMAAFSDYQAKRAWAWEHQALTRARFCAGDVRLGARFENVRDAVLAQPRDGAKLREDIAAMRKKMRDEHKSSKDLKHVRGGVIDLEFCVQAIVLEHGPAHAQLRENKGNHELLRRAGDLGLLDPAIAIAAADAYLALRKRTHEAALNDAELGAVAEGELSAEREAVQRLWAEVFGA